MASKNLDDVSEKLILGQQTAFLAHFRPKNLFFLRYTHITPLFWARIDPTWWDHISPISWGNSGYLQFLGRWPFGRSAGRFTAPIAQSGLFRVKNAVFRPETHFSETSSKKVVPIVTGHQKDNSFVLTHCMAGLWGAAGSIFGQKLTLKTVFFHATPCSTHFWGSDGLHSMGS